MLMPILAKPYTRAVATDIRETFALERMRLAALQEVDWTRQTVREAVQRAQALGGNEASAIVATAQALCLPVEAVLDCLKGDQA